MPEITASNLEQLDIEQLRKKHPDVANVYEERDKYKTLYRELLEKTQQQNTELLIVQKEIDDGYAKYILEMRRSAMLAQNLKTVTAEASEQRRLASKYQDLATQHRNNYFKLKAQYEQTFTHRLVLFLKSCYAKIFKRSK